MISVLPLKRVKKGVFHTTSALLTSLLLFSQQVSAAPSAQPIPNFNATFLVHAYGFDLGKSKHQLSCQSENCTLVTYSKPEGWVRIFFKDSAEETIQVRQTPDHFLWQGYQKQATRYKHGEASTKLTTYQVDQEAQQVTYLEKKRQWPWNSGVFDASSIAYAIQWHALNNKDLAHSKLILQTPKKQYPIEFSIIDKPETLKLKYGKEPSRKYRFGNQRFEIDLWLLPEKHQFPGKLRIYDREEDKTIILALEKAPKFQTP